MQRDDTLRVGVVGVGWAGRQHLAAYDAVPGVEVAAVAALEATARGEVAARFGVERHFERWEDLLEIEGLDAVSVAAPTFLHAPVSIAALKRGIHVLCEKPLARTVAEGTAMVEAARRAGRVLDVAFNKRRRGDIRKLQEIVAAGRLGSPYYAKTWWMRGRGIPGLGSWFTRAELAGGGPLLDIGVHVLDYALFVLGGPTVRAVSASTYDHLGTAGFGSAPDSDKTGVSGARVFDVEDLATVFMRLEGGGTLLLEASWAAHRPAPDELGLTVFGTRGGAELVIHDQDEPGSLRIFTDDGGVPAETRLATELGGAHDLVVEQFVRTVRSGDWDGADGSAALQLARVVECCYRSAAEGREVQVDAP
jgi:predicted dehydrogenase